MNATLLTVLTGIVAALFAFRQQQRLRAFDMFLGRRDAVLLAVEEEIKKLHEILAEARGQTGLNALQPISHTVFRDGLVLMHRMRGCALGPTPEVLASTYYSVLEESIMKPLDDPVDWLGRLLNSLSLWHATAHGAMSQELDDLRHLVSPRWYRDWRRKRK